MSSGPFENTRYQTDDGNIVPIRIQPETLTLTLAGTANAAPAGALQAGFPSAKVSGSRRSIGINSRIVRIRVTTAGTSGLSVGSVVALPWLVEATFDALPAKGATGTYNGASVVMLGKTKEQIN